MRVRPHDERAPRTQGGETLLPGKLPANLFACAGHGGQYVIVSPGQKLTIVRLGKTDDPERTALRGHLAGIAGMFARE